MKNIVAAIAVALLTACGGGGGGTSSTESSSPSVEVNPVKPDAPQQLVTELLPPIGKAITVWDGVGNNLGTAGIEGSNPQWLGLQWEIPVSFHPATFKGGDTWEIGNQYGSIKANNLQTPGAEAYDLTQTFDKCYEYALFLEHNNVRSIPLSEMKSLVASVKVEALSADFSNSKCDKGLQFALGFYSVVLKSGSGQVLFYQIRVSDSRNPADNGQLNWCPTYEVGYIDMFCVDEDVRSIGGYLADVGRPLVMSADVLPRLKSIVASGHVKAGMADQKIDTDLSKWTVFSVYIGNAIEGQGVYSTRWSNPSLKVGR